jgi:hypothetical protein
LREHEFILLDDMEIQDSRQNRLSCRVVKPRIAAKDAPFLTW